MNPPSPQERAGLRKRRATRDVRGGKYRQGFTSRFLSIQKSILNIIKMNTMWDRETKAKLIYIYIHLQVCGYSHFHFIIATWSSVSGPSQLYFSTRVFPRIEYQMSLLFLADLFVYLIISLGDNDRFFFPNGAPMRVIQYGNGAIPIFADARFWKGGKEWKLSWWLSCGYALDIFLFVALASLTQRE